MRHLTPARRLITATVAGLAVMAAAAGCSSSGGSGATPSSSVPSRAGKAAEPAVAPPTSSAPAGTVESIGASGQQGALPQGIAYSSSLNAVVVAVEHPDRLLVLDPSTLAVEHSISIPGSARHLQLSTDGRTALVPAETAQELVQVTLPTGPSQATKVLRQPHDATQASNGDVAVADEYGHALSVVRDDKVVHTFRDLVQPGGAAADGTNVAVVDVGGFTVSTYDLSTMKRTARLPAGDGPTHVIEVGRHRILVADTRGGHALLYSDDPLRRIGSLDLPGEPYGVAGDPTTGLAWVTLTGRNEVVGLDTSGSTLRVVARYATVRQPDTVAVAPGSHTLWITGTNTGQIQRITR